MRAIFNFVKDALRKIDGYWIENAGHPITVKGVFKSTGTGLDPLYREDREKTFETITPTLIYGFYNYPKTSVYSLFGIDAPDELTIQLNAGILCNKLGKIPEIGTLLNIEEADWIVINRGWIYNRFIGKYRIELTCQGYQESTTLGKNGISIQTSSKHTILDDEE